MNESIQLLRATQIHKAGIIPASKGCWFRWVARRIAPRPIRIGRILLWSAGDIRDFSGRPLKQRPVSPGMNQIKGNTSAKLEPKDLFELRSGCRT